METTTKEFKGTKGSWNNDGLDVFRVWVKRPDGLSSCICQLENQHAKYSGYVDIESEERKANAKLIAAAPDLLEALQMIVTKDGFKTNHSTKTIALNAINKALGKWKPT